TKLDDPTFLPRCRRRIRELERLHAIVDRRAELLAAREHGEEVRQLVRIGSAISFQKKMLWQVTAHRGRGARDDFGGRMVARLQHAFAAQHLESLVVTVSGAPARVDLAESAAFRTDRDRRGVDVAGFRDCGIDEAWSGGGYGFRIVGESSAK